MLITFKRHVVREVFNANNQLNIRHAIAANLCKHTIHCQTYTYHVCDLFVGWGYTHVDLPGTPRGAQRGRHRPPKPRKGRALKGNRKAKGKPGRAGWDDEDEPGVSELPPVDPYGRAPGVPLAAPVVEGIFGWRWPISQHDLDRSALLLDISMSCCLSCARCLQACSVCTAMIVCRPISLVYLH